MHPEAIAIVVIGLGFFCLLFLIFNGFFRLKEKKMEIEAEKIATEAASRATSNAGLEQRVRVLEQIVTDGGAITAAQIEALRDLPQIEKKAS